MDDIQKVMRINPHSVSDKGQLVSLSKQYAEYSYAREWASDTELKDYTPFIVCVNGAIYGVPDLSNKPLILTNAVFKHIVKKHKFSPDALDHLALDLSNNMLVYQQADSNSRYVFVLEDAVFNPQTRKYDQLISVVEATAQSDSIEVAQIRSIHGKKELVQHMYDAVQAGKKFYPNERTDALLKGLRDLEKDSPLVHVVLEHIQSCPGEHPSCQDQYTQNLASIGFERFIEHRSDSGEYFNLDDLNMFATIVAQKQDHLDEDAIRTYVEEFQVPEDLDEYSNLILQADEVAEGFIPVNKSAFCSFEEVVGRELAGGTGLTQQLEEMNVDQYFNYEDYGADYLIDCIVDEASTGYFLPRFNGPNLNYYDHEELRDESGLDLATDEESSQSLNDLVANCNAASVQSAPDNRIQSRDNESR